MMAEHIKIRQELFVTAQKQLAEALNLQEIFVKGEVVIMKLLPLIHVLMA